MTIMARRIAATPVRSTTEAWNTIVDLLAPQFNSPAREELMAVAGIACSLVSDETMKTTPIVLYGSGPRVRIYCLYDEEAVVGDDADESPLPVSATDGDWHMSLPCMPEDISWIQKALAKISRRITAREMADDVDDDKDNIDKTEKILRVDKEAFFRS